MNIIKANIMKVNKFTANIDTRATRSRDALVEMGVLSITFKGKSVRMGIDSYLHDLNRDKIPQIERIIHNYIGEEATTETMEALVKDLTPLVESLEVI